MHLVTRTVFFWTVFSAVVLGKMGMGYTGAEVLNSTLVIVSLSQKNISPCNRSQFLAATSLAAHLNPSLFLYKAFSVKPGSPPVVFTDP